jgi:hypothetical protein
LAVSVRAILALEGHRNATRRKWRSPEMSPWAALGSGVVELAGWWQQLVRLIGVAFRERRRGPRDRGELRVAVGVRVPFIGAEVGRGSSLKEALWYRRPFICLAISGDRREIMGRGARWAAFSKKRGGGMAWHEGWWFSCVWCWPGDATTTRGRREWEGGDQVGL